MGRKERKGRRDEWDSIIFSSPWSYISKAVHITVHFSGCVSRNLLEETLPFYLFDCFVCCKFDSMAHFLKGASAFGFKPSSPWRVVLWVLVFIVWDKGSEIPTTATLGPELSELSQDLLMCPWSYVLWATCFIPRASLVINRLEYTLFKTQQIEKSIYGLKRWHKYHFFSWSSQ